MYKAVSANKRNTVILMMVFAAVIGGVGWIFAFIYSDMSIFAWTLGIAVFYALIQYFAAGNIAVAMTGAQKIEKQNCPRLWHAVETISISTGLPMPEVYLIDDLAPNAFATGRDPKHAVIAATTGLVDTMDDNELMAVMAHEMSHVQNYDIRVSMIVFGLVSAIGLIADIGVRLLWHGNSRNKNPAVMVIGLVVLILAPIVSMLVRLAVSRQREYLADSSAVLITRYPAGMTSALDKLRQNTTPMRHQNPATEALWINNPMKKGFINNLFSTHPPIEDRIARIEQNQARF
ncbi:MAG: M48 family metallopeptidase [Candidatus Nomurabacteria bacterium]|jgi:heat shock protein HtpX|nr:M48 family metallopeptidase [Candidatus Nomurabacteria bacterium]